MGVYKEIWKPFIHFIKKANIGELPGEENAGQKGACCGEWHERCNFYLYTFLTFARGATVSLIDLLLDLAFVMCV